jgi:tetratricopeptide (TPR) repeat protein
LGKPAEAEAAFRAVLALRPEAGPARVGLGTALSAQAKHDEALEELAAAEKAEPKDAGVARALGLALTAAGRADEGRARLEAAAKLAPKDAATARALAEALLRAGDAAGARQVGERLAKAAPKHPMGDFLVGLAHDRLGESAKAIEAYERALAKDEAFLDAHKNLAILCQVDSNTYSDQERVKQAFAHYERYFALGGADPRLKQMYDTMKAYFTQAPDAR